MRSVGSRQRGGWKESSEKTSEAALDGKPRVSRFRFMTPDRKDRQ